MLGHRGCRLGITYPEIYEMQARAIFEAAAIEEGARQASPSMPEIMIPLVAMARANSKFCKAIVDRVRGGVRAETRHHGAYMVGTMIELPRAALWRARSPKRRVLLVRHQRSDADDARPIARRRRRRSSPSTTRPRAPRAGPVRHARPGRRRRTDRDRRRARARDPPRPEARHLRRAWRRSRQHRVLPEGRAGLRVLLAVPRRHRAPGRRASRARRRRQPHRLRRRFEPGLRARLSTEAGREAGFSIRDRRGLWPAAVRPGATRDRRKSCTVVAVRPRGRLRTHLTPVVALAVRGAKSVQRARPFKEVRRQSCSLRVPKPG